MHKVRAWTSICTKTAFKGKDSYLSPLTWRILRTKQANLELELGPKERRPSALRWETWVRAAGGTFATTTIVRGASVKSMPRNASHASSKKLEEEEEEGLGSSAVMPPLHLLRRSNEVQVHRAFEVCARLYAHVCVMYAWMYVYVELEKLQMYRFRESMRYVMIFECQCTHKWIHSCM